MSRFTLHTKLGKFEGEVRVTAFHDPGHPGSFYRSNGDPGDPPEPPETYWEKLELKAPDGSWIDITELANALVVDPGEDTDPIQRAVEAYVETPQEPSDPEPQEPIPDPAPWWEKV